MATASIPSARLRVAERCTKGPKEAKKQRNREGNGTAPDAYPISGFALLCFFASLFLWDRNSDDARSTEGPCRLTIILAILMVAYSAAAVEAPADRDARMQWWRDARFGMFMHWGLYAVPAGEWDGKKVGSGGEWILNAGHIPMADYEKLRKRFNPTKFDAKAWVKAAHDAGMQYMVITSKHHDGFCMWPSKVASDWTVGGDAVQAGLMRELADACKADGTVRFCVLLLDHGLASPRCAGRQLRRTTTRRGTIRITSPTRISRGTSSST